MSDCGSLRGGVASAVNVAAEEPPTIASDAPAAPNTGRARRRFFLRAGFARAIAESSYACEQVASSCSPRRHSRKKSSPNKKVIRRKDSRRPTAPHKYVPCGTAEHCPGVRVIKYLPQHPAPFWHRILSWRGINAALRPGHDPGWIRASCRQDARANIPPRCNRSEPICVSPYLYRPRNLGERFFHKIKHCRRLATRYDNLARTTLLSFSLRRSSYDGASMSSRPKCDRRTDVDR
jgi:hypothetical protein